MKNKIAALVIALPIVLVGCTSTDLNQNDNIDIAENNEMDNSSYAETVDADSLDVDTQKNNSFTWNYYGNYDDEEAWLDVTFEPDNSYEEIIDGFPDYSGIYQSYWGANIPYGYCNLIKQLDGTYYCELYIYRCIYELGTATYVSDGVLEYKSDYYTGTIKVDGKTVHASISDNDGHQWSIESEESHYNGYPDLKDFLGTYKYYRSAADIVTITVYLDGNRSPMVQIEDDKEKIKFDFNPPYTTFWPIDYNDEKKLCITNESIFYGPDDDYIPYVEGYCGNTYLVIDNGQNTSKVLYKCLEPHYLK